MFLKTIKGVENSSQILRHLKTKWR